MINLINNKIKDIKFDIERFSNKIIRQIFLYLNKEDQLKLLQVSKKWRKSFLPLLWESFLPNKKIASKQVVKLIAKYSKFIKFFSFIENEELINDRIYYSSARSIATYLYTYIEKGLSNSSLDSVELWLSNIKHDGSYQHYFYKDDLILSNILKKVDYLVLKEITEYFVHEIIPLIPSTIKRIHIKENFYKYSFIQKLLAQVPHLCSLSINFRYFNNDDVLALNTMKFSTLKSLNIYSSDYTFNNFMFDSSLLPQLIQLACQTLKVQFKGEFKIRDLMLRGSEITQVHIYKEYFTNLRILDLQLLSNIGVQWLYNIFQLQSLTALYLHAFSLELILEVKEVYPKTSNQLITLYLRNFSIDYYFYRFLFNCCKSLENLTIKLDNNIPFYTFKANYKPLPDSFLKLTRLTIQNNDKNLDELIYFLIKVSPRLEIVEVNTISEKINLKNIRFIQF